MKMAGWVAMAACANAAWAQCGMTPSAIIGGSVSRLAGLADGRAVVLRGSALELYDLTDPSRPELLDRLDARTNPGAWREVNELRTSGTMAFAFLDRRRVWMFDTSGGRLTHVGTYPAPDASSTIHGFLVGGSMLYSITNDAVEVVDISRPDQPVVRSSTAVHSNGGGLLARGACVYTMTGTRLTILDCTDPAAPVVSGMSFTNLTLPRAADGDRLWVRPATGPVRVYDIGRSVVPTLIGEFNGRVDDLSVTTVDGVSYLTLDGHFVAADLSDLSAPRVLGTGPENIQPPYLDLGGGALAALGTGFSTVDASNPASMSVLATRPGELGSIGSMAGDGPTLWTIDAENRGSPRLTSWDLADPAAPRRLGRLDLAPGMYHVDIAADGGLILLTWTYQRVSIAQIVDGTDPSAPRLCGSVTLPWTTFPDGVALQGRLGAVTSGRRNLLIDLTDLDAPTLAAELLLSGPPWVGLALDGDLALFGSFGRPSILAFDVSSPRQPTLRFTSDFFNLRFFAARGGVLATISNATRLQFQRTDDPAVRIPAIVGGDGPGLSFSSAAPMAGGIAAYPPAFIDVSDPRRPFLANWLATDVAPSVANTGIVAGVRGAVAAVPSGQGLWVLPTGSNHPPAIREAFPFSPGSLHPCPGEPFELRIDAAGSPDDLTYQWYDGGRNPIPGETSPTLRIPRINAATLHSYRCVITNACGSTTYPPSYVFPFRAWSFCIADFNCDGTADFFDDADFVGAFEAGDLRTDVNGDDFLDFFDYADFAAGFEAGC